MEETEILENDVISMDRQLERTPTRRSMMWYSIDQLPHLPHYARGVPHQDAHLTLVEDVSLQIFNYFEKWCGNP